MQTSLLLRPLNIALAVEGCLYGLFREAKPTMLKPRDPELRLNLHGLARAAKCLSDFLHRLRQLGYSNPEFVPSLVLDFKVIHPVSRARARITVTASRINAVGDSPSASEAGIWVVKVRVVV